MSKLAKTLQRGRTAILQRCSQSLADGPVVAFSSHSSRLVSYATLLFDTAIVALEAAPKAPLAPVFLPEQNGQAGFPAVLGQLCAWLHTSMLDHLKAAGVDAIISAEAALLARFFHHQTLAHLELATKQLQKELPCDEHAQQKHMLRHTSLSRQRLVTVLDVAKIGFFDWDMVNDRIEFSDQFQHDWQLASGANLKQALARIHQDDRDKVQQSIQKAIVHRTPFKEDYRVVRPDGTVVWVEARGKVNYDEHGTAVRFMGTSQDISQRVKQHAMAQRQQMWWQSLLHGLPLPIVMVEPGTGAHTFSNLAADTMFGRTIEKNKPSDSFGEDFYITNAKGVRLTTEQMPSMRAASGETITNEEFIWHTDTGSYDLLVSARTMDAMYDHPAVIVCPFQDVTELKTAQRSLKGANQDLKDEILLREKFVSALSHDMRTPLTAIRLAAQKIERKELPFESAKQTAHRILNATIRMDKMIQNMLDVSRIKAGERLNMTRKVTRIDKILQHEVDQLNDLHAGRVTLYNEAGALEAQCDHEALQRMVDNLVNNAVKYGDPTTPVRVGLRQEDQDIEIDVHNEGPPISVADQQTLFDPYFRSASALEGGKQGWGIGLTLVHEIARAHGGHVAVSSALQQGTRFAVRFPLITGNLSA